jgi:hypothetical protein
MTRARDKASAVVANFTSTGIDDNADANAVTISSDELVGIGTATPASYDGEADNLVIASSGHTGVTIASTGSNQRTNLYFSDGTSGTAAYIGGFTYNHSDNSLLVRTSGAERMRILSSGGITFNGDTAAANALDDYEQGTWTPVIQYGAGSSFTTITSPNSASGAYRKIGNLLYISFYFYKNSSPIGGSGGTWRAKGFPFAIQHGATCGYASVPVGYWAFNGVNYFNTIPSRWQANGSDFLDMYGAQASTAWSSNNYEVAGHGVLMTT